MDQAGAGIARCVPDRAHAAQVPHKCGPIIAVQQKKTLPIQPSGRFWSVRWRTLAFPFFVADVSNSLQARCKFVANPVALCQTETLFY
jgi:hypothetical protein